MVSKFFKIIVHDDSSIPTLLGICAGFENGEWRGQRLADNLFNCIPDFCLSYSEVHEVDSTEWMDKLRKSVAMIYNSPKYKSRGEFGELLFSVRSGKQLCFKIKQFEKSKTISNYLNSIISRYNSEEKNNELIECALDFMRQWLNYKFPRYLMTLQDVVNEILEKKGLLECDYSYYASYVECYFTKPYVIPFDECGLPIQISTKIKKYISNDSIDSAIESLRNLETEKLQISSFEKRMIRYVQRNL